MEPASLIECLDCESRWIHGFPSMEERGRWAAAHTAATGHVRWRCMEYPPRPGNLDDELRAAIYLDQNGTSDEAVGLALWAALDEITRLRQTVLGWQRRAIVDAVER